MKSESVYTPKRLIFIVIFNCCMFNYDSDLYFIKFSSLQTAQAMKISTSFKAIVADIIKQFLSKILFRSNIAHEIVI